MSLLLALQARTAADSLGTTDAATRVAQSFARGGGDTLGTSDAATRAPQAPARTASDSLGTSDAATRAAALRTRTADDAAIALDLLDNFSTDTFGAGKYTYLTGSGVTVSAGTTSFPLGVEVVVTRNDRDPAVNWRLTSKRIRASANDINHGLVARVIDNNNYILMAQSGGILQILKKDGGSFSSLVGASPGADTSGQSYWLRATFIGDRLTLERFVADPLSNGPTHTLTYQLLGADATKFAGQPSLPGMRWLLITSAADATGDDFRIERVGTFDAAARAAQSFARTAADSLGTSDLATRVVTYPRTTSDSLGTSDSATRAATSPTRAAADSLGTSDSATRLVTGTRTTADALGTTDSATRSALTPTRSGGESLYSTDGYLNLIHNPSFEVDVSGAVGRGSGVTLITPVRTTAQSFLGSASAQFTQTGAASTTISAAIGNYGAAVDLADVTRMSPAGGIDSLRVRIAVRVESLTGGSLSSITVGLRRYHNDGTLASTVTVTLQSSPTLGTWYEGSFLLSVVPGGDIYFAINVGITGTAMTGAVFQVDQAQLVFGGLNRAYIDGSRPFGTWHGTADDSVSEFSQATRAAQTFGRAAADSLGTSDAATRALALPRTAADSLGTSDAATRGALLRARTTSDSLVATDAATRQATFTRTVTDGLGTSDAATRAALLLSRAATDSLGTSDAATRAAYSRSRTSADSLGTTDAATRGAAAISRTGADALGTSDAATTSGAAQASAADTLGTSDAASRAPASRARATADTLATSDAATRVSQAFRTASDTLATSDAATRAASHPRTAADSIGASDSAARAFSVARTASDALASSDAAARAYAAIRQAQDSLAVSDHATRTLALVRQAIDELGTSDAADATFIPAPAGAFELFGTASTDPQFAGSAATRDRRPGSGGARDRAPASEGTREMVAGSASTRSMG